MLRKPQTKALDAGRKFNCSFVTVTSFGSGAEADIGVSAVNGAGGPIAAIAFWICIPRPDVGYGLSLALGPPLWNVFGDSQMGGAHIEPNLATDVDLAAQKTPGLDVDRRVRWWRAQRAILSRHGLICACVSPKITLPTWLFCG
jgi:hypothetical protein